MRRSLACLVVWAALGPLARAQVEPVAVRVPDPQAWVGQRLPVFVELRAPGSFAGSASFELPRLPGTLLMKIGNPVVSSEVLDGESWFVQTHELALFSQRPGTLEVPSFSVHFARREGFTGPATDVHAQVPGWSVQIRRPPGSDRIGFLITTQALEVTERWDPQPGPFQVGALLKREIVQRGEQVSGMALAPAPTGAPEGVRVYAGEAAVEDRLQRGEFRGERRETITYLLTAPGSVTLPALEYVWWNPVAESLESTILPAVTVDVAAAPAAAPAESGATPARRPWRWLPLAALAFGLVAWRARPIAAWGRALWRRADPPDRVAARKLLRACRRHDPVEAQVAWQGWRGARPAALEPGPELRAEILDLQRRLFGQEPAGTWRGDALARAFRAHVEAAKAAPSRARAQALPALNPHQTS